MNPFQKVIRYMKKEGLANTIKKVTKRMKTNANRAIPQKSDTRVVDIYQKLVDSYEKGEIKGIAILNSAREFDEVFNQRTINYAKYLSEKKYGVIYVAWQWEDDQVLEKGFQYVYENTYEIPMYPFLYSMNELHRFKEIKNKQFVCTFPTNHFAQFLPKWKEEGFDVIYDIMDEWEEFSKVGQAPWYQKAVEAKFVTEARVVAGVSKALKQKFAYIREDILVSGNGYHPNISKHPNIAKKEENEDRTIHFGYFGHLTSSWFDWNTILELAKNPKYVFHFIGHGAPDEVLKQIENQENLYYYGKVHPSELYEYVKEWHVGLIPFKPSKLAEAVDPIKIYEYLFFGLPTISSGIPHIGEYPNVFHCESKEEMEQAIEKITKQENLAEKTTLDAFLASNTWEKQFDKIEEKRN